MASLIVVCPQCLTWIEIQSDCCPECATAVSVEDVDPPADLISDRMGDRLRDLGAIKLLRRGWPENGQLIATTEGLLFVPHLVVRPNGALEPVAEDAPLRPSRVSGLFQWWSLPPWRRSVEDEHSHPSIHPPENLSLPSLLFDSPGAFFIVRTTIQHIVARWGRVHIERQPSRSVSLTQAQGSDSPREILRPLIEYDSWRSIVAGL
ncbi:MAG: hypothetical protein JWP89_650 [Schlesneria sp.]|nr:hypothetical protein [Schlesneria sp.]